MSKVAYWFHDGCTREHRWLWTSKLHLKWWKLRERVGYKLMIWGAKLAREYEPLEDDE